MRTTAASDRPASPAAAARRRVVAACLESLEQRRLLAVIEGNFYFDSDGNGVKDFFEEDFAGITVFLDQNENGRLDDGEPATLTNENGTFAFRDLEPGTYFVGHSFEIPDNPSVPVPEFIELENGVLVGTEGRITLGQTAPGLAGRSNSEFDINIDFSQAPDLAEDLRLLVETSVSRWEQVIIGDLVDANEGNTIEIEAEDFDPVGLSGEVDDLTITVFNEALFDLPGVLAFAAPTVVRDDGGELESPFFNDGEGVGLPAAGEITLNTLTSENDRQFVDVVIHEIGHVLGIGSLWDGLLINRGTLQVGYVGENGLEEYNRLFESDFSSVPVEPFVEGHWDESRLTNELMTPFVSFNDGRPSEADPIEQLSRLTIGALEDFGFEVNYRAADFFDPDGSGPLAGAGPLSNDPISGGGSLPTSYLLELTIEDGGQVIDDANFGVRYNLPPQPFFFNVGAPAISSGQELRLLAEIDDQTGIGDFTGDVDFRDAVVGVAFYAETNGTPGLQTPGQVARGEAEVADFLIAEDGNNTDGFEGFFDSTGFSDQELTFYAAAYDAVGAFTVRTATTTIVSTDTAPPVRPANLRVLGADDESFTVVFNDTSSNEAGFALQIADSEAAFNTFDAGFDPDDELASDSANSFVRTIFLPAQAGTGRYETTVELGDSFPNLTRVFRVRAYNPVGFSPFGGRETARTLGPGEILLDDDADNGTVTLTGDFATVSDNGALALTYVRGSSGTAVFEPLFAEGQEGRFTVLASVPDIVGLGDTLVSVFSAGGELLGSRTLVGSDRNGQVVVGQFNLSQGSTIVFSSAGDGDAFADTVRLLPADDE